MERSAGQFCAGVMLAAGFAVAIAGAGCESPPQPLSANPAMKDAANVGPADGSLEVLSASESPSDLGALATQSQRDVDLILNSRITAKDKPRDPNEPSAIASAPKSIAWSDTKAPASANRTKPEESNASRPVVNRWSMGLGSLQNATTQASPVAKGADGATASPTAKLEPDRLKSLMVDLSRELYANGSYSATPLRELLMIAAMSMIDPQRQLDPQAIPDLTEKERELLGKLQAFFAELGRGIDGKQDTEKAIVEALAKLRESLVKPPTLRLKTTALCTRVGGFGDYAPFEKYSFLAQSNQKAIVYLEIDDFTSELNQKNEYVTQIAQQLIIYSDRDGIPVWKEDWQSAVDVTKNKRQDFFTVQVITLPQALTVGKYQLKVRARDEKSGAEAEAAIPFELVADPRLVGK